MYKSMCKDSASDRVVLQSCNKMQKSVQTAIENATSETLIHSNLQLNMQVVELVNYRPDV